MCCPLVFEFSVGIGGFVIGLGQISFFFSFTLIKSYGFYFRKEEGNIVKYAIINTPPSPQIFHINSIM